MNETLNTIDQLRSVRSFTDQPISKENLDTILGASIRTANASSRQSYSIIVLTDQEKMQTVCGYKGAVTLVYCVDCNRLTDIADYLKQNYERSITGDFITGSTDTVLAAQTAVIAAKSLGIDSLITNGVHRQDFKKIYEVLKLPESSCFPLLAVVLGYPQATSELKKGRTKAGVIHYEEYKRLKEEEIEAEISLFDSEDHKYGVYADWKSMGFEHYYEWFYQVWNRTQEDKYYPFLKEINFLP
jgi:nitroreductase